MLQCKPSLAQPNWPGHGVAVDAGQSAVVPSQVPTVVSVALVHAVTPHTVPAVAIAHAPDLQDEQAPTGQLP
jgi:hypothetical protein